MLTKIKRDQFNQPVLLAGILFLLLTASACSLPENAASATQAETQTPAVVTMTAATATMTAATATMTAATATMTAATAAMTAAPVFTATGPPPTDHTPTIMLTATAAPTSTTTQTATHLPTEMPTQTPVPTYAILRGEVLQRSNCRYGPGAPYLYKYGLVAGSNLDVIGRNDLGTWILVRAIGGDNPCWVKASLMDVGGDVMSVEPTYIALPQSPYYGPPTGVSASRNGDEVAISWNPISFRAGDDTASAPYLVEAWICSGGELIFTPIGSYETSTTVIDESGCSEPSHGRVFGVEKHGYTNWIEIPWPEQE